MTSTSPFDFSSPKLELYKPKLIKFLTEEVEPNLHVFETQIAEIGRKNNGNRFAAVPPVLETLKSKAKALGLWNLWMPKYYLPLGAGLSNLDYAQLAEIMGRYGQVGSESAIAVPLTLEIWRCCLNTAPQNKRRNGFNRYWTPNSFGVFDD